MTSDKQIAANRRNAARSTGPRTDEGKKSSSMNALQHGMTAETPLLPNEDPVLHEEFRKQMTLDLAPVGAVEEELARAIVNLHWSLRRFSIVELGILAGGVAAIDRRFYADRQRALEIRESDLLFARKRSPDDLVEVVNEEAHDMLTMQIAEAEQVQRSDEVRLASAFVEDAAGPAALTRLSRYEASLSRRLNQLYQDLEKRQAQRRQSSVEDSE